MTTPKQDMKRLKIIITCGEQIRCKGGHARAIVRMPGVRAKAAWTKFSAKGPRGKIIAQTHDRKKILVMFRADQLLTSLEEIRHDNATG